MGRKRRRISKAIQPLYPHHVEAWIRASGATSRALLLLLMALERQQTPKWQKQFKRAGQALTHLNSAADWIRLAAGNHERNHDDESEE